MPHIYYPIEMDTEQSIDFMREYYTLHYEDGQNTEDSLVASRTCMVFRITELLVKRPGIRNILNIGAGLQEVEAILFLTFAGVNSLDKLKDIHFTTLDLAEVHPWSLQMHTAVVTQLLPEWVERNVRHVTGNFLNPKVLSGKTYDLIISNMAIDLLPRDIAIPRVYNMLNSGGTVIFNFHHRKLFQHVQDNPELIASQGLTQMYEYLDKNELFYRDARDILLTLNIHGFKVKHILLRNDIVEVKKVIKISPYWEVVAEKFKCYNSPL